MTCDRGRPQPPGRRGFAPRGFAVAAALFAAAAATPTMAADADWLDAPYRYAAIEQDLTDVLHEFGKNLGIPIRLNEALNGAVTIPMTDESARSFLDNLGREHGFIWYYDGFSLHFVPTDEALTRFVNLRGVGAGEAVRLLSDLQILDRRFPLRILPDGNVAMVSGPPAYVELIESALATLRAPAAREVVLPWVFRGRRMAPFVEEPAFGAEEEERSSG